MVDVKNAFKKGEPITGRPCNIARELFKELQGDGSIGDALDVIIRQAATNLELSDKITTTPGILTPRAKELLNMWDELDELGEKYTSKEG